MNEVRVVRVGSLAKELLVGLSGIVLILFILGHLAGNFFLFTGPDRFNAYAKHLHSLGPLLWAVRLGLLAAFIVHVSFAIWLALDSRAARTTRYAVRQKACEPNFAKRTMLYSGLTLFAFLVFHIADFAFRNQAGPDSVLGGSFAGESLGLYGIVWNSFANPLHSALYIVALCAVGLHFSNAVAVVWMTFGVLPKGGMNAIKHAAQAAGALVAFAFISIPVYVLAATYLGPLHL